MHGMGKTVTELHAMLKLHDQTLPQKDDAPALHAIRAERIQKNQKKKPHKAAKGNQGKGKAKMGVCTYARRHSFMLLNPRILLDTQEDNPAKDRSATNVWEYPMKQWIFFLHYHTREQIFCCARHAEFFENSLITQEASGSLEDLEIIQEDTHPSIDTSLNHEENDQEIDEP
ncbi:hypothetical protein Tco_1300499 [Tanacetum coccineum]